MRDRDRDSAREYGCVRMTQGKTNKKYKWHTIQKRAAVLRTEVDEAIGASHRKV